MTQALRRSKAAEADARCPATAALRAGILTVSDAETLVQLFADALAEHGVAGHFCVAGWGDARQPVLGDAPGLLRSDASSVEIEVTGGAVLLTPSAGQRSQELAAWLRGYAELYAARARALAERADDVETGCVLTLRQRYVLGRRLAGLAAVDIAIEAELSVETVAGTIDQAMARLGSASPEDAIALAARRGWLAVTAFQNCSSNILKNKYNTVKNG